MSIFSYLVSSLLSFQSTIFLPAKYGVLLCFVTSVIFLKRAQCCHPDNQEFIRCFHVYLERDFNTVQSYLERDSSTDLIYNRYGKVLMEGPYLDEICERIEEMDRCMERETQHGCLGFVDMEPLSRLLHALRALTNFLCSEDKERLQAFLTHGGCIMNFQSTLTECQEKELDWPIFWAKIFRLEKTHKLCKPLYSQSTCVLRHLPNSRCDSAAIDVYNDTMRTWLDNWCNSGSGLSVSVATIFLLSCSVLFGLKTLAPACFS